MRVDLGDDPAVVQIAARLDTTEDEVVGKLHRLWSWADKHTTDGTAPAITAKWVDRYVGSTGFADAMTEAGWISFSAGGVLFPSFDRHNGESAKRRGEAAIRQRLSRKNRDDGVTGVTRTAIPRPFIRHVMERDNHTCVYCGRESSAVIEASRSAILSVDHLIPAARGGASSVENLACCCCKCNGEKNDRTPEEWDLLPTFLQPGVIYKGGSLVTDKSQKLRDKDVTREEKRREEDSSSLRSEEGAGKPATRKRSEAISLKAYLENCKQAGARPLPPDHPIRDYCTDARITDEMLQLAWIVFKDRFTTGKDKAKRQKDWPAHFANSVRGRWANLWHTTEKGETCWTSAGLQERAVAEARMKPQIGENP